MTEMDEGSTRAFSTFRVLNGEASTLERDQLFRNMAQLFTYVSDRCDDDQVAQYDEVLCQLAALVETEARTHVAGLLAPLDRAPGNVVAKLANDGIEVARPLLERSNVLSDDDLIEIVAHRSEGHRAAIAGRGRVSERVAGAIVEHGETASVLRLLDNAHAELGQPARQRLALRAASDAGLAAGLRQREALGDARQGVPTDIAGERVVEIIAAVDPGYRPIAMGPAPVASLGHARQRIGFNGQDWKVAYNQVKALADRRQLDEQALTRFAGHGYGHHTAAALAMLLRVGPEIFVKWLATQDYAALTVALRALGIGRELFDAVIGLIPWRDAPSQSDLHSTSRRFEALSREEAIEIFELWRSHAFRRRAPGDDAAGVA